MTHPATVGGLVAATTAVGVALLVGHAIGAVPAAAVGVLLATAFVTGVYLLGSDGIGPRALGGILVPLAALGVCVTLGWALVLDWPTDPDAIAGLILRVLALGIVLFGVVAIGFGLFGLGSSNDLGAASVALGGTAGIPFVVGTGLAALAVVPLDPAIDIGKDTWGWVLATTGSNEVGALAFALGWVWLLSTLLVRIARRIERISSYSIDTADRRLHAVRRTSWWLTAFVGAFAAMIALSEIVAADDLLPEALIEAAGMLGAPTVHELALRGTLGLVAVLSVLWALERIRYARARSVAHRVAPYTAGFVIVGAVALTLAVLDPEPASLVESELPGAEDSVLELFEALVDTAGLAAVALALVAAAFVPTALFSLIAAVLVPLVAGGYGPRALLGVGAGSLFVAGLLVGTAGAGLPVVLALVTGAILVWDAGDRAITVREEVESAPIVELVGTGLSAIVGILAIGFGTAVGIAIDRGYVTTLVTPEPVALVALVLATVLLAALLRSRPVAE